MKVLSTFFLSIFFITILMGCGGNPITEEQSSPPTVLVSVLKEGVFKVRLTNKGNTDITLHNIKLDVKPFLINVDVYQAVACIRELGSMSSCGKKGTSLGVVIPTLNQTYFLDTVTTNLIISKNGGALELEVYVESNYMFPKGGQLQVDLKQIEYSSGNLKSSQDYTGISGTSAVFTK